MKNQFPIPQLLFALGTLMLIPSFGTSAHAQVVSHSRTATQSTSTQAYDPWAQDLLATLSSDQLDIANSLLNSTAPAAVELWEQAMRKVLNSAQQPDTHLSLVYQIAERTLQLAGSLKDSAQTESRKCPSVARECVDRPYQPILEVYKHAYLMIVKFYDFDRDCYFPTFLDLRRHGRSSVATQATQMESLVGIYALEQLEWFTDTFRVKTSEGNQGTYSNQTYYVMLSALLKGLILDLGGDIDSTNPPLFVTAYAKSVAQMKVLVSKLDNHIAGNSVNGAEPGAFWTFDSQLNIVKESLRPLR